MPNDHNAANEPGFIQYLQDLEIYDCYTKSPYLSIKVSSYFQVYQELLAKYRNVQVTFVEIGVLNGGSLYMWRRFLGPNARIIGIDLNPAAKQWEAEGFEIYIGNQADSEFWDTFFAAVGNVDVILDDGGHTNEQQIITAMKCLPHLKDGGLLIVEDFHSSYLKEFGNPFKYSFKNFAMKIVDSINSRFQGLNASSNPLKAFVYSVTFYESIVCFRVDRKKCFTSEITSNNGISINAEDYRNHSTLTDKAIKSWNLRLACLQENRIFRDMGKMIVKNIRFAQSRWRSLMLRNYFR